MCAYAIGLDIGISSVGWATVRLDGNGRPCGIIGMNSRIFDVAEHRETGASLAAPRREARSARRRLRRHRHRNERIKGLLCKSGVLSREELAHLFDGQLADVFDLRVKALDQLLTREEFARILLHISQRRGFRSNRKDSSGDDGKLLDAVNQNRLRMVEGHYRTVGEMFCRDPLFAAHKRNKGGNYLSTVSRDMVEEEVRLIFIKQREMGNSFADSTLEEDYLGILLSQRSFDEGPGGNSPYGGNQIEKMVGFCTFEPEEPRAAKACYSFEYFSLLEKINHITLNHDGKAFPLTDDQRKKLIELAHSTESLNYAKIRKELRIPDDYRFNTIKYTGDGIEEQEKKEKFCFLKAYHQMRKEFDRLAKGYFASVSRRDRNAIGTALTLYKTSEKISVYLEKCGLENSIIKLAEGIGNFSGFGHLSVKACDKIIPYLEQGMKYHEACDAAGYNFKGHEDTERSMLLHPTNEDYDNVTSPVVRRAISQTIKVLNAIIRKQGESPVYINIEIAREMAKDFQERNKIKQDMESNQAKNERIMQRIQSEFGVSNASGLDLVKLKLFEEQDGRCAYSQKQIPSSRLFEQGYCEVDHIIPYSISFDDSYKNKVLVLTEENRNKGNRLPMQYMTGKRRDDFVVWVNTSIKDYRKRQILLKEEITTEDEQKFKERNLQDTKTASRFLLNYIGDNLAFSLSDSRKKRVTAVNGAVTSYLRKRWGIAKIRANGDKHHAVDALVIACTTDGLIQQLSRYSTWRECRYVAGEEHSIAVDPDTGEVLRSFPYPWPEFRKELEARLSCNPALAIDTLHIPLYMSGEIQAEPIFVSRMPRRKVTGAAHKDTVKSARMREDGLAISKRPLTELKLKNGEIENYYDPSSDRLLYEALKKRLVSFGGDAKKAFAEPFYKPKRDGTPGAVVNKVKLYEPSTLNVPVQENTGIADNDSRVRVDVFYVENDGYYLVPIYVADTLKPELPCRACVAHKPYEQWKIMAESDFVFSLYPNDLIRVTHKKGISLSLSQKDSTLPLVSERKETLLYFCSMNISSASICCITDDNTYKIQSLGVKSLERLEKYSVDVLGEYHPIRKEKRLSFH